jgi:hypothetical protein
MPYSLKPIKKSIISDEFHFKSKMSFIIVPVLRFGVETVFLIKTIYDINQHLNFKTIIIDGQSQILAKNKKA